MGKKDFLLLSGALALLVAAPAALAEVSGEIISQSKQLNTRENEGFLSKNAEFQLEVSTQQANLSPLFNPGNIPKDSSYNFQKLPASEFSLRKSQMLPSVAAADVVENTRVRHNSLPSADTPTTTPQSFRVLSSKLNTPDLPTTSLSRESSSSPTQDSKLRTQDLVTQQSLPDFSNPINLETNDESTTNDLLDQVTSVSVLSDVQPTDWAFSALKNLVERYGCIAGYPDSEALLRTPLENPKGSADRTFRGNRPLTRYEFAAGLNACATQIERLIAANTADFVRKQDLATLQRLSEEFRPELTSIRSRVDNLEARTTQLENHQFSTTAIIGGEVIFGLATAGGGNPPGTGKANTILSNLTRLQVVTTFTGIDRLRLELAAGNFSGLGFAGPSVLNTFTSLLSYQTDTGNKIQVASLEYRFPAFNNRVVFTVRPIGFSLSSVLSANSPYFDTGRGSISRFGEGNPIFKIGALDAGIGFDWLLSDRVRLQVAYGSSRGNESKEGFLFSGSSNALGAQLLLLPGNNVLTGLTFVYGYSSNGRLNTFTGSAIADASGFINLPSNIYALSGTLQWRLTPKLTFSTWGGFTATYAALTNAFAVTTNFMFALGFSDPFGRRGDLFALMIGQPPKLIQVVGYAGANGGLLENASSLHLEAFYRFTVTDKISITPGLFVVTNPGNISDNNAIYVGTIRTTFRF